MNAGDRKDQTDWLEPTVILEFKPTRDKLTPPDQRGHESEMAEVQDKLKLAEFAKIMIKALRAHGDQRTIAYDDEDRCLRFQKAGRYDGFLNLSNLYFEYGSLASGDRDGWLRRTVVGVLHQMEIPDDFEDVRPDLLPAIRSRSASEFMRLNAEAQGETYSIDLASIPVSEHLEACLVYDMPNAMRFVTRENLSTWGVSLHEAFPVATQNLAERECKMETFERHLVTFVSGDGFDATRMLMIDRIRS